MKLKRKDAVVLGGYGGTRVTIKDHRDHGLSEINGITLSDFVAANLRLQHKLMQSGKLSADQVPYYMSYTLTLMEYYESFNFEAILRYDHRYRIAENATGMVWGTPLPALDHAILQSNVRPRPQGPLGHTRGTGVSGQRPGHFNRSYGNGGLPPTPHGPLSQARQKSDHPCHNWVHSNYR